MKAPNNKPDNRKHQLIVDFPADRSKRQADKRVRFASLTTVQPITSVLTMCSKQELWYSKIDEDMMRLTWQEMPLRWLREEGPKSQLFSTSTP